MKHEEFEKNSTFSDLIETINLYGVGENEKFYIGVPKFIIFEDGTEVVEAEAAEEETAEEDKVSEADTEEEIEEKVEDTEVAIEKPKRSAGRKVLIALGVLLAVAAVLLGVYVGLSRLKPEIFDSILYSAEELEILNYRK